MFVITSYGHAIAQAVSDRPLITEAQIRTWVSPCGICGGQSGTGTGFSLSSSVFPCQYHSTTALHLIIWGIKNSPVGGCSSDT
jgi:hypothetical protein